MRRTNGVLIVVVVAICLCIEASGVFAEPITVRGQLVDLACYIVDKGNAGNAHKGKGKNCARACATEGFPVGLVGSDGKAYHIVGQFAANSNAKLIPFVGNAVVVTGEVKEQGGQLFLTAIEVKAD